MIEAPCPALAGLKRDLRFATTRPVDELKSCRSSRVAQVESLRGMRSLEHFHETSRGDRESGGKTGTRLAFGIELRGMVVNRSYKRGTSMYAMQRKIFFRRLP